MQKLAKKWGPHAKGTRVTADAAEADEAPGQSRRWPVLLVGASRLAWLEEQGYFRAEAEASFEDPDGGVLLSPEAADLVRDDITAAREYVAAAAGAETQEAGNAEAEAEDEPEAPPSMRALTREEIDTAAFPEKTPSPLSGRDLLLTDDSTKSEPSEGGDDGR